MDAKLKENINRVRSIHERMDDFQMLQDGKVQSNYIVEKVDGPRKFRRFVFESIEAFAVWREKNAALREKKLRSRLTPH